MTSPPCLDKISYQSIGRANANINTVARETTIADLRKQPVIIVTRLRRQKRIDRVPDIHPHDAQLVDLPRRGALVERRALVLAQQAGGNLGCDLVVDRAVNGGGFRVQSRRSVILSRPQ